MTLDEIGIKHGTDKSSVHHNYLIHYEKVLKHLKNEPICLFELGWGGYAFPERGGQSVRMWREYFQNGEIVCLELYKKNTPTEDRVQLIQGSQTDEELLSVIMQQHSPDVVLDDASHINSLTIKSFEIIFPLLKSGGIYIVEDVHTSYWKEIASDGTDFGGGTHPRTTMNYFKSLTDGLNEQESGIKNNISDIESIQFFKEMIIIKKK